MPKALLIYGENPVTFWSYDETLEIIGKKSTFTPNPLLSVAGMLPGNYDVRLVDENVERLTDKHLEWADFYMASGMIIHKKSIENIIKRTNEAGKPLMVGGPLPSQYHDKINGYATYFLGEAENAGFLEALEDMVRRGYRKENKVIDVRDPKHFTDINKAPLQRFDLIRDKLDDYFATSLQITRGCPEPCIYCDIPIMYGKKTRIKNINKVIEELDALYDIGWRGMLMFVDDNLAGNQEEIKPILKEISRWQEERGYPFRFVTQASLRIYDDEEFLETMYTAGFAQVFFGVESPSKESLKAMGAQKNIHASNERGKKSMLDKIKDMQANYFRAKAGFILGFDEDPDNIADLMKEFIQESRIGVAMVGPLGVLPGTPLYKKFEREGRLVKDVMYDGGSGLMTRKLSYVPMKNGQRIDPNIILDQHRDVLEFINKPENYFARNLEYFKHRKRKPLARMPASVDAIKSLVNSLYVQGMKSDYRKEYFNFLGQVVKNDPMDIGEAVASAIVGHHLITATTESLKVDDVSVSLEMILREKGEAIRDMGHEIIRGISEKYNSIKDNFKASVDEKYRKIIDEITNNRNLATNS